MFSGDFRDAFKNIFPMEHLRVNEAAFHRYSYKKVFQNYATNLQENKYVEVWFQ